MSDNDLFKPTIEAFAAMGKPPFSVPSLVYPALLGGPVAITALALVNGQRLGVPARALVTVAATGAVAMVTQLAVLAIAVNRPGTLENLGQNRAGTLLGAVCGAAVYAVVNLTQRSAYRSFQLRGGEPAKLIWPALLAIVVAVVVTAVAAVLIIGVTA